MANPYGYFNDNKRSEVNELRQSLQSPEVQRDGKQYREACQKVIQYMTLGIDVSRLFSEMIMASASSDLVQKKLVYLYLCNYAESHSDLTLLAVNTLQKSCRDHNPMVRGLALRSMCSLRVPNLIEYVLQPLQDGLRDKSPYVRRTAVLGCVKLFYVNEAVIYECNIPDTLYAMLRDKDPQVVANAVIALEEILASEGGVVLTRETAHGLFNLLRELNEWSQCGIMRILVRYVPSNEDEIFDILNVLEERLKHANAGVVMAAAKLFLHFTRNMEDLHADILERLKTPLITQMTSGSAELCYACLHHLQVLLTKMPALLASEFASFFCRYNDAGYVKSKKLEILTDVCDASNMEAIVEELSAYITDVDGEFARNALRSMGNIAIRLPSAADHILSMLLLFLDLDTPYVTAGTLIVLKDLLRKYPSQIGRIVPRLEAFSGADIQGEDPEAREALIWMFGEYGQDIESAPYILEYLIDHTDNEASPAVRLQLLSSTVKLFFKRPPECQRMLGRLFEKEIEDEVHTDVHDRALFFYRLMQTSIEEAKRVILCPKQPIDRFTEHQVSTKGRLLEEFNTLSVIYGMPSVEFITQQSPYNVIGQAAGRIRVDSFVSEGGPPLSVPSATTSGTRASASSDIAVGNLLDSEFSARPAGLLLNPKVSLPPAEFEKKWLSQKISCVVKDVLSKVPAVPEFTSMMAAANIKVLASSPPQNGLMKFYLYSQETNGVYHLIEVTVDVTTRFLTANIKSDVADNAGELGIVFRAALSGAS